MKVFVFILVLSFLYVLLRHVMFDSTFVSQQITRLRFFYYYYSQRFTEITVIKLRLCIQNKMSKHAACVEHSLNFSLRVQPL
jgi:hypothetical protein